MAYAKSEHIGEPASINVSAIQSRLGDLLMSINGAVDMAEALHGFVHRGSTGGSGTAGQNAPKAVPASPFDLIDSQINDGLSLLVDLKKHLGAIEARVS